MPEPGNPQSLDRYAYALNNPVKYSDPTGHWVETALDVAGLAYDIYQIRTEGWTTINTLSLVVDVACLALPVATGGGMVVRAASHADDVADAARAINRMDDTMDAARAAANAVDSARTLAKVGADSAEGAKLVRSLSKASTQGGLAKGGIVSLGHLGAVGDAEGYIDWARKTGAAYLNASPEVYKTLEGSSNWWRVNQQFLDDAIEAGVTKFHLQTNSPRPGSGFAQEIDYLIGKGWKMVEEGGEWWLVGP